MELTLKDIKNFYGCLSDTTAIQRVKEIKAFFNIEYKKRISLFHLAKYEGLSISEVRFILQGN